MLHSSIKKIAAITITLTLALSITSCTVGIDSGFVNKSQNATAAQGQNTSILIQTVENNYNRNTSDAAHQLNQTDHAASPISVTSESQSLPDDMRQVFIDLRNASLKHLDAFQKTRG